MHTSPTHALAYKGSWQLMTIRKPQNKRTCPGGTGQEARPSISEILRSPKLRCQAELCDTRCQGRSLPASAACRDAKMNDEASNCVVWMSVHAGLAGSCRCVIGSGYKTPPPRARICGRFATSRRSTTPSKRHQSLYQNRANHPNALKPGARGGVLSSAARTGLTGR
jgi:hypothetical protein